MTEHQYRTELRRYANSDLSELACILFNKPGIKAKPETLAFGTAFHSLILEPEKFDANPIHIADLVELTNMHKAVLAIPELVALLGDSRHEVVDTWEDPTTGLPLKCKMDIKQEKERYNYIADLKTTSCKTKAEFLQSCHDYDYDRQAAFYLSSDPNAKFFEFIGVQKVAPYNVYRLAFHRSSDFIRGGNNKKHYLLRAAKAEADKGGWRPSSWEGAGVA